MKKEAVIKNLHPRHIKAIQLHLLGAPLKEIAGRTGLSDWWISRILKSESAQRLIAEYNDYFDQEFKAFYTGSIKAIHEGLRDPDINSNKYFFFHDILQYPVLQHAGYDAPATVRVRWEVV